MNARERADGGSVTVRLATPADAQVILAFIEGLALYEREPDAVQTDATIIAGQLAEEPPPFECLLRFDDDEPVGFALFFHNYSTWRGRRGLYLEDLFVPPEHRGRGHGLALFRAVAAIAVQRGCPRMEWSVLDWNTPAIDFYRALGAVSMDGWTTFRLADEALVAASRDDAP